MCVLTKPSGVFCVGRLHWLMLQTHLPITQKLAVLQLFSCNYLQKLNWRQGRHPTLEDLTSQGCILMKMRETESLGEKCGTPHPSNLLSLLHLLLQKSPGDHQLHAPIRRAEGRKMRSRLWRCSCVGAAAMERQQPHSSQTLLLLPLHGSGIHLTPANRSVR